MGRRRGARRRFVPEFYDTHQPIIIHVPREYRVAKGQRVSYPDKGAAVRRGEQSHRALNGNGPTWTSWVEPNKATGLPGRMQRTGAAAPVEDKPDLLPHFCKYFVKTRPPPIENGSAPCHPNLVRALDEK
ncbi:hypothetical protein HPB52_024769 [Rhipicephalus sanguineus]|uniref:Uncharacterized protein n=1 Tax=Rhipicephalus sanguineus TaxID=34632 RepID=A0A9D4TDX8_RHISA|nr:hypothetical protein HPB52_024769 [Rhipicephalus sanguineus]